MEELCPEMLQEILSHLDFSALSSACSVNSRLAAFFHRRELRLNAFRNECRGKKCDELFLALFIARSDRLDEERLTALLDLHPSWVNEVFATKLSGEHQTYFPFHPLEVAYNSAHLSLLLERGANPNLPSHRSRRLFNSEGGKENRSDFYGLYPHTSTRRTTIKVATLYYADPVTHLLILRRERPVIWRLINFTKPGLNVDALMHYARTYPPDNLDFLPRTDMICEEYYFPLLTLLSACPGKKLLGARGRRATDNIISRLCSVYQQGKLSTTDTKVHLKVTSSFISYSLSLDYYQLCGLALALDLFQLGGVGAALGFDDVTVRIKNAHLQGLELQGHHPLFSFMRKQSYRLDAAVPVYHRTITFFDDDQCERTLQYEEEHWKTAFLLNWGFLHPEETFKSL